MTKTKPKPQLDLSDADGNAFRVIAMARRALRRSGYSAADIKRFTKEASRGNYDTVLMTCMEWFDVD